MSHYYPIERRIHGGLVFAADGSDHVREMLKTPELAAIVSRQSAVLTGAFAYAIERSETIVDNVRRRSSHR